jgi:hypothetical protein
MVTMVTWCDYICGSRLLSPSAFVSFVTLISLVELGNGGRRLRIGFSARISRPNHSDLSRTQQRVMQLVTSADHIRHPLVSRIGLLVVEQRVMTLWIKGFTLLADPLDSQIPERVHQRATDDSYTLTPRMPLEINRTLRESPFEIVKHWQQSLHHLCPSTFNIRGPLSLDAALVVQEVSPLATQSLEKLLR